MTNNKQQTAMQEHIAWLKEQLQQCIDDGYSESWIFAYELAIDNAESMLEKEKQIIINAIITCEKEHYVHSTVFPPQFVIDKAEQYYKQTYIDDKQ
jgi:hypothetical protein